MSYDIILQPHKGRIRATLTSAAAEYTASVVFGTTAHKLVFNPNRVPELLQWADKFGASVKLKGERHRKNFE